MKVKTRARHPHLHTACQILPRLRQLNLLRFLPNLPDLLAPFSIFPVDLSKLQADSADSEEYAPHGLICAAGTKFTSKSPKQAERLPEAPLFSPAEVAHPKPFKKATNPAPNVLHAPQPQLASALPRPCPLFPSSTNSPKSARLSFAASKT